MQIAERIVSEFFTLTIHVIPYFILGIVSAAALATWLKTEWILKYLNKGKSSIVNASLLGALLPGCSCTTMPIAHAIKERGASLATVSSFIFVSALLSPQTIILTYGMLGTKFAVARIIFSLVGAIIIGFLFQSLGINNTKQKVVDHCCDKKESSVQALSFWKNLGNITGDLGKYFFLGMFIASVMLVLIPKDMIPQTVGSSGIWGYIVAALIGIPVYICEGEEVPLTAAFLRLGLEKGPAMTFLLGAVGTCIPTMIMAPKIIGKKFTLIYILFWIIFAVCAGIIFSKIG